MQRGYVKLWRKSLESRIFNNSELWKVWTWCLLKASHKSRWVSINVGQCAIEVEVGPGQFIYGRHTAAAELGMPASSVRNRMEKLKKIGNLDIRKDSHYSIVTVCNWERYQPQREENGQAEGQPEDSRRTAVGHKQEGLEGLEGKEQKGAAKPPVHPAVQVYQEMIHLYPRKTCWSDIEKIVGEKPQDLDFWGKVTHSWDLLGRNPKNVAGMLECFQRREIPTTSQQRRFASSPEPNI